MSEAIAPAPVSSLLGDNFPAVPTFDSIDNMKIILMIGLCSAALLVSGCATPHSDGARWEYKVMPVPITQAETIINGAANDGWVLQSASYDPNGTVFAVMKRHKKPQ